MSICRRFPIRRMSSNVRSTAASGSQIYESRRAVDEYLFFHYGDATNKTLQMPYRFGPVEALDFPARCAQQCAVVAGGRSGPTRALDIGCSVGGASFELARYFDEVVGIDFSQHFVDAAREMQSVGEKSYTIMKQGFIEIPCNAKVPEDTDRSKVRFEQGDACALKPELGTFDVILASNLLCRLPSPRKFILSVSNFLRPGGYLVMVSPYSWLEEYTDRKEWFGADYKTVTDNGSETKVPVDSFDALQEFMFANNLPFQLVSRDDIPFLIREHERKFQYGVSDCNIWRKV